MLPLPLVFLAPLAAAAFTAAVRACFGVVSAPELFVLLADGFVDVFPECAETIPLRDEVSPPLAALVAAGTWWALGGGLIAGGCEGAASVVSISFGRVRTAAGGGRGARGAE